MPPNPYTSKADPAAYKYPYLLRDLKIIYPNQVWAADITYIGLKQGFMYLFAIIDLYSRYILAWDISNSMTANWCVEVLKECLVWYPTPEIFNTDQGSQFTADLWINQLKENGIQISMDGKGRAIDNIFIERFWRS
ncbi:MAG: transposase family protein, partial [Moorea sp. SIO3H5]|nr:transposase family protein [Moorena sp. SIO3H5]